MNDALDTAATNRKWRDHESSRSSEILVAVDVVGTRHADDTVVNLRVPVVAHLFLPLKVRRVINLDAECVTHLFIIHVV